MNRQFNDANWIAKHKKAIETVANFSGLDFQAAAISLYDRTHKQDQQKVDFRHAA